MVKCFSVSDSLTLMMWNHNILCCHTFQFSILQQKTASKWSWNNYSNNTHNNTYHVIYSLKELERRNSSFLLQCWRQLTKLSIKHWHRHTQSVASGRGGNCSAFEALSLKYKGWLWFLPDNAMKREKALQRQESYSKRSCEVMCCDRTGSISADPGPW